MILVLSLLFHLAWDDGGPRYNVYRMDDAGVVLVGPSVDETLWVDESIAESSLYTYWVKSVGDGGVESDPSNSVGVWTGIRGDANRDGIRDATDTRTVANWLAGNGGTMNRNADMDDNFQVNLTDLVLEAK